DDGTAVLLERSAEAAVSGLAEDGDRWRRLFAPLVADAEPLLEDLLAPLHLPPHPLAVARFRAPPARRGPRQRTTRASGDDARSAFLSRHEGTSRLRRAFRALHAPARPAA